MTKRIYSIEILNQILLGIEDYNLLQKKAQPYVDIAYQKALLKNLKEMSESQKANWFKYIAILVLSQEKETLLLFENESKQHPEIIRNIIKECKCSKIKENAEKFLQTIMRDIT